MQILSSLGDPFVNPVAVETIGWPEDAANPDSRDAES
jgi:hypothetical protein